MEEIKRGFKDIFSEVDWLLFFACLALSVIGVIFVTSSHITSSDTVTQEVFSTGIKELKILGASLFMMFLVFFLYRFIFIKKFLYLPLTLLILLLLVACLAFEAKNNAKAWIHITSSISIQPSEFAKSMMILIIACTMTGQTKEKTLWQIISFPLIILFIYLVVIALLQNDMGSALALGAISYCCLLIPGDQRLNDFRKVLLILLLVGIAVCIFICLPISSKIIEKLPMAEYKKARFTTVYAPFDYFYDAGYQVCNSLIAFARGSITGVGLGNSVQKFGYLPYAESDFIIAVIAEEGGFIVLAAIFIIYGIIIGRLMYYAFKTSRQDEKVMLFGSSCLLVIHILLNIGGATATIPLTGVPLIMLSAGGTSLVNWYILLGVDLRIISNYRRRIKE